MSIRPTTPMKVTNGNIITMPQQFASDETTPGNSPTNSPPKETTSPSSKAVAQAASSALNSSSETEKKKGFFSKVFGKKDKSEKEGPSTAQKQLTSKQDTLSGKMTGLSLNTAPKPSAPQMTEVFAPSAPMMTQTFPTPSAPMMTVQFPTMPSRLAPPAPALQNISATPAVLQVQKSFPEMTTHLAVQYIRAQIREPLKQAHINGLKEIAERKKLAMASGSKLTIPPSKLIVFSEDKVVADSGQPFQPAPAKFGSNVDQTLVSPGLPPKYCLAATIPAVADITNNIMQSAIGHDTSVLETPLGQQITLLVHKVFDQFQPDMLMLMENANDMQTQMIIKGIVSLHVFNQLKQQGLLPQEKKAEVLKVAPKPVQTSITNKPWYEMGTVKQAPGLPAVIELKQHVTEFDFLMQLHMNNRALYDIIMKTGYQTYTYELLNDPEFKKSYNDFDKEMQKIGL